MYGYVTLRPAATFVIAILLSGCATPNPTATRSVAASATTGSPTETVIPSRIVQQLTDSSGGDGWPAWSPDGSSIAFTSERDDCSFVPTGQECWQTGEPDDQHRDVWLMDADGANQRRITSEAGQFVAWSPEGRFLLVSGRALYVVRPDGTGRLELRAEGIAHALGGIPDWR